MKPRSPVTSTPCARRRALEESPLARGRREATLVLATAALGAAVWGCPPPPPPPPTPPPPPPTPIVIIDSGLSADERESLYHLPEGSEYIPVSLLRALHNSATQKPFLSTPERYGLLADPKSPDRLPIGMASPTPVQGLPYKATGFNCAACHVNELTYKGTTIRIDGAPSLFSLNTFLLEMIESLKVTISSPKELFDFIVRWAEQEVGRKNGEEHASVLRRAFDKEQLPAEDEAAIAEAKARMQKHANDLLNEVNGLEAEAGPLPLEALRKGMSVEPRSFLECIRFLIAHIRFMVRLKKLNSPTSSGPGRLDAFGGARALVFGQNLPLTAPVRFPFLWGFPQQKWLHYDANTNSIMQRNLGQALGLGAVFTQADYKSTLLPRHIGELDDLTGKLRPPAWPAQVFGPIDEVRAQRGSAIFQDRCGSCHGPGADGTQLYPPAQVGTDPNRANNFAAQIGGQPFSTVLGDAMNKIEAQSFKDHGLTPEEIKKWEVPNPTWRTTNAYSARPMTGVWAAPPYLHNGSVPTLRDLLSPASERPACFQVGSREYDVDKLGYVVKQSAGDCPKDGPSSYSIWFNTKEQGNSNAGHEGPEYGTNLSDDQKLDLIEYLKSI